LLRHRDVPDHGAKNLLRGDERFARGKALESVLDVVGQDLERPNVELFRR